MPIQINLLNEAQAQEDLRRRDPVKRAIFGGVLLVVVSLVWFSSSLLTHMVASNGLSQIQAGIESRTNDYNAVVINLRKVADTKVRLEALSKLSAARFLQGNLMNSLQQLYVPNVRLMRFQVEQTYSHVDPPASASGAKTANVSITEHTLLTLDARDSSANPGDKVNRYKDVLSQLDFIKANLSTNNGVKLSSLSAPQPGSDGKPYVMFTVECRFTDQTR